jgi:hypothetical protein
MGGALQLDGQDGCVVTDFVRNPAEGPFSALMWVRGGAPGQAILSQVEAADWLRADPTDGHLMTGLHSDRQGAALSSEAAITDGEWHRVGLTWDGANRSLYVDDVLVAQDAQTGVEVCFGGLNIGCGVDMAAGSFFWGLIDDVRLYNRAVKP